MRKGGEKNEKKSWKNMRRMGRGRLGRRMLEEWEVG